MTGLHSVILSPDSVSRVSPPTTMIENVRNEHRYSHFTTAGVESCGGGGADVVGGGDARGAVV